ncbi:PAS domain S-box-containing protein/diguanylate cyclase (GGDEF) domain-containing protein [Pseudoduganella namucuonensis]|uniref:PAS domain S-box-containing protein/diguanylate cyclase (GGDEF) domain-containing protein n=1 Tax=Pseudoduganella namucuonensis TaxID=1035707 RepID=A0A1I7IJQ7_9BURK|nr:PAS domain S-box-containing protein/diguanylate cyclase (GGDEF) domain-containing protein [Pseudoduganella namucuonensis]
MAVQNEVAHWRAQIFMRILQVVLALGLVTALPSIVLSLSEGIWSIAVIDVLAIAWIAGIWRLTHVSYRVRVLNFLAVTFLVGIGLMVKIGPLSQIYLVAVPMLAALLLGLRAGMWALAVDALALGLIGYASNTVGEDTWNAAAMLQWAVITLNYVFIMAVLTLSCGVLLQRLERSIGDLQGLNEELRLTSTAVARLNDMVMIAEVTDDEHRIIFVNKAFERRTGYQREEVLGRSLRLLKGPDTSAGTLERIAKAMSRSEAVRAELLNYTRGGEAYWVETELVPFADEGGNNTHWVAVERDITERKKSEDDIHRLAYFDVLTGLPNRRLLMDRIDKLLASSERGHTYSAVMFIDLDNFKYINDARGHAIGDALLKNAAGRLEQLMRKADTVARIGGDEFVVLLAHLGSGHAAAAHAALVVAEKIRLSIAQDFLIEGQNYSSSASIGVTLLPKGGQSAHDLLREADIAMYRAKADGRNGIAFFEAGMQAEVEQRLNMERDLALAIDAQRLWLHAQPQVDCAGRVVGAELLMRWQLDDGGWVPPSQFIPLAEESGQILQLGAWALRQACGFVLELVAAGHAVPLSVNVSPNQFRQPDFVEQVRAVLAETGAPANMLIFEVTEGLLVEKMEETIERMHALAALGIRFSIDDFGTGYSSLAYLKKMPLYELKIDRSFIQDTPADPSVTAIVQSILAMAHHLGLQVVAEGVETRAQADFLVANRCQGMQGYLFARPQPFSMLLSSLQPQHAAA